MKPPLHLTITGTFCGVILVGGYWIMSSREAYIAEEIECGMDVDAIYKKEDWTAPRTGVVCLIVTYIVYVYSTMCSGAVEALLRKATGLKSSDEKKPPIQLGPHDSYKTLILSVLSCAVTLGIIWLIKVAPLEKLYKCTPLYKLGRILYNGRLLEAEDSRPRGNPELTAGHQKILNTCMELDRRMCRLEQCLTPLARSLQTLSEVIETRNQETQAASFNVDVDEPTSQNKSDAPDHPVDDQAIDPPDS